MPAPHADAAVSPPQFLQLAGHPLRWRLLTELASSDRTVQELTALAGEAQNLVSYHLAKLRDAGIVTARRSSADGRDAYYAVDLARFQAMLSSTADALHPGLLAHPPSTGSGRARPVKVLFLCTGNSARSQMAEALARDRSAGAVESYSAGSNPKPLHPNAVRAMRAECGIDISKHASKHLGGFSDEHFDWVITLCDRVREVCPEFPGEPKTVHWSFADPSASGDDNDATYPAFQQLARDLESRVGFLLAVLTK